MYNNKDISNIKHNTSHGAEQHDRTLLAVQVDTLFRPFEFRRKFDLWDMSSNSLKYFKITNKFCR